MAEVKPWVVKNNIFGKTDEYHVLIQKKKVRDPPLKTDPRPLKTHPRQTQDGAEYCIFHDL